MMIPQHLELKLERVRALIGILQKEEVQREAIIGQIKDALIEDLKSVMRAMLDFYAMSKDFTPDEALGMAESLAMAHPDYEKAASQNDIEVCLKRFFMFQEMLRDMAGAQPWMRNPSDWSRLVFTSAMKPIGTTEWNNLRKET